MMRNFNSCTAGGGASCATEPGGAAAQLTAQAAQAHLRRQTRSWRQSWVQSLLSTPEFIHVREGSRVPKIPRTSACRKKLAQREFAQLAAHQKCERLL